MTIILSALEVEHPHELPFPPPVFGIIAATGMALLGGGNLLAARGVKADGVVAPLAKVLMVVGALAFIVGVLIALRVFG